MEFDAGDYAAAAHRVDAQEMAGTGRIRPSTTYAGDFQELRARVAEARGDTTEARAAWRQVLGIGRTADPELQTRVAAARAALSRLGTSR
jgi:hypothetical protein